MHRKLMELINAIQTQPTTRAQDVSNTTQKRFRELTDLNSAIQTQTAIQNLTIKIG